jgi:hypothetical protein
MDRVRRYVVGVLVAVVAGAVPAAASAQQVLRVGSFQGIPGQFTRIQAAVDAAKPGDWILVGPGDYKEHAALTPAGSSDQPAGLLITTSGLRLRGMNRGSVVVDGTTPGSPRCSSAAADQETGPGGHGLNGILVWKANDVWVQNLTACNYYSAAGNIWWNGGDNSAKVGGWGFDGSYLTATTTFYKDEASAAQYGIFSSNWSGGNWQKDYASNFNDSGFYIGACQQICDQTVNQIWSEYNALGYSGSNSGGRMLIENSQFDNNTDGFDTNSQNGDNPPPQNGACPAGVKPPVAGAPTCWVFTHNYVHDNNNPNVPALGSAAAGPVGTGMSVSGGRNDTVMDNTFSHNGAWGTIFVPYPDNGPPCTGGTNTPGLCLYDEFGDALLNNKYSGNGFFGNPTNGDVGAVNLEPGPTDCYSGNTDNGGPISSSPGAIQTLYPSCNGGTVAPNLNFGFLDEVACDSQAISLGPITGGDLCPPGANYPRRTQVVLHPLPQGLQAMPDPCAGVPANPWCTGSVSTVKACVARSFSVPLSLAMRERFLGVKVTVNGVSRTYKLHGRKANIRLLIGGRRARVRFVEWIKVRSHREKIVFTRIYHRC